MRLVGKLLIIVIIIGLLLGASAYVIFYTNDNTNNNSGNDTEPPQITGISGNLTVTAGESATITVHFTDNINVTVAKLYYEVAGAASWNSESILSGTVSIPIPASATSNYYYYVTVDDAAGNGPIGDPSTDGSTYYTITVTPGGSNPGNETLTHTVFLEEATATWCTNCPNVANILHSLYETHAYNFYYVSLINGSSPDTADRLYNDYNTIGFPTVFVDGGYKVIFGGNNAKSVYTDAINASNARTVPKIKVTVAAQYKNTTKEVTVNTLIENRGNDTYNGRLKLYLTEIISHLADFDSKTYQFGFLEYLVNQEVSVPGNENVTISETKNISAYNYENLMIIGVVFSSVKQQGYADPLDNTSPFDAYYADATNATTVVPNGNLPPQLQITFPQKETIYRNEKQTAYSKWIDTVLNHSRLEKLRLPKQFFDVYIVYNISILRGFGTKKITVDATDDSAVAKVEFYVDGTLQYTDKQAPYEWTFKKISTKGLQFLQFRKHTLKVVVYDDTGKTNSASLTFKAHI